MDLLSRCVFRDAVFCRDGHRCVLCGAAAGKLDAHHIMERRLWPDGGYYVANGVTVCEPCHRLCESTQVGVDAARAAAGIDAVLLPPHLYANQAYDKWGNPILPDGRRLRGELSDDPSVRKIMAECDPPVEWVNRIKYPRTWHLPWSPGATKDDRKMPACVGFEGRRVVVSEKMDGENTTLYSDGLHARSLDYQPHESRSRTKALWASICADIPAGWRVCGENLEAAHSIGYTDLPALFLVFGVWDGLTCLSWDDTVEWAALLGLMPVRVLYDGMWDEALCRSLTLDTQRQEGYVVRVADAFHARDFRRCVGKWVRAQHVQTHGGWMRQQMTPNTMR